MFKLSRNPQPDSNIKSNYAFYNNLNVEICKKAERKEQQSAV